METDVVLADIEEIGHLSLREPDSLVPCAKLDLAAAVFGGVEDEHQDSIKCIRYGALLSQDILNHMAMHIGETPLDPIVIDREGFVIQAE